MILLVFMPLFVYAVFDEYRVIQSAHENKWDVVQEFYENKIKDNPRDAAALFSAGVSAFKKEELDRASALFSRAAELNAALEEKAMFNIGNIAMIQKKYKEALDAYEAVLKINPAHERARERAELARQLLQQPPQQDSSENNSDNKDNQENEDQNNSSDSNDSKENEKEKQDKKDSSREDTPDQSHERNANDNQQQKNEKGQRQGGQNNKKPDQQSDQKERQGQHEEAQSQAADQKKDQRVESQDNKSDHDKKAPQKNSQNQSKEIDPKDQWKTQLFSALDKVEEGSHKDMMQVVYGTHGAQDQTSQW